MPDKRPRTPTTSMAFEVPIMDEVRTVSELTGLPAARIREHILAEIQPKLEALIVGHVHTLVLNRLNAGYRQAATESLEAAS